jgi:hypothetical protein
MFQDFDLQTSRETPGTPVNKTSHLAHANIPVCATNNDASLRRAKYIAAVEKPGHQIQKSIGFSPIESGQLIDAD